MAIFSFNGTDRRLPRSCVPVPDAIVQADLWANTLYPQQMTAITFMVGAAATTIALSGERSWRSIVSARVTDEQTTRIIKQMDEMHRIFKVPYKFDASIKGIAPQDKSDAHYFGPQRLHRSIYQGLNDVTRINKRFVSDVLPRAAGSQEKVTRQLFTPDANGHSRPEGQALNSLWIAGAEAFKSTSARAIAREYRPLLSPPEEVLSEEERLTRVIAFAKSAVSLQSVVLDNIEQKVSEIVETTGVAIMPNQASRLMSCLFDDIYPSWIDPSNHHQ